MISYEQAQKLRPGDMLPDGAIVLGVKHWPGKPGFWSGRVGVSVGTNDQRIIAIHFDDDQRIIAIHFEENPDE